MNKGLQRIRTLLDADTFMELDGANEEGLPAGTGKINGHTVCVYAHNPEISAGAMSEGMISRICTLLDTSVRMGVPFIELNESAGARIQNGVGALAGLGEVFRRQIAASGTIPQIAVCFGSCAGGAVYSSSLADFTIMIRNSSYMYLTGPSVVRAATGEDTDHESLGGADIHGRKSGVAHFIADSEEEALKLARDILGYLWEKESTSEASLPETDMKDIVGLIPNNPSRPYDMHDVITVIADRNSILEVHNEWASNIICSFARIGGHAVGIVANQPKVLAGSLDGKASMKAARFIGQCDRFRLPVITLVDVPGFLCGSICEHEGIITQGTALLREYAKATIPKITVTLRKSYGGAHIAMCCKQLGGGVALAWPDATLAVMGKAGAGKVIHDTDGQKKFESAEHALKHGYIDEIVVPEDTRSRIIDILASVDK